MNRISHPFTSLVTFLTSFLYVLTDDEKRELTPTSLQQAEDGICMLNKLCVCYMLLGSFLEVPSQQPQHRHKQGVPGRGVLFNEAQSVSL